MEDVNIIFKPTIDDKEIKQEMQQIAKTSKTAIEQSFKSLDLTMRKSIEAWGNDMSKVGKNIRVDEFVGEFQDKMRELKDSIVETGNLPLGMTTKILDLSQQVDGLIKQYQKLGSTIESMSDADKFVETTRYKNLTEQIIEMGRQLSVSKSKLEMYNTELEAIGQREQMVSSLSYQGLKGEEVVNYYNTQIAKIEELEEKIQELRRLQGADPAQGRMRGLMGAELEENQRQVEDLQAKVDGLTKSLRFLGAERTSIIQAVNALDVSPEHLGVDGMEKLRSKIQDTEKEVKDLTSSYDGLIAKRSQLEASGGKYQLSTEFKNARDQLQQVELEIVKAASRMNEFQDKVSSTGNSMSQMRNVVWSISRVLGNVYTIGLDIVRGAKMIANIYNKIWGYVKKIVGLFKQLRENVKKTGDEHKKSWAKMLKDIIRYSLGIRSLFMLFRRLRGYIKEAFKAMAEQIPEVNQTLSELKSSFNMLKGSLATAFEPLISALAPALLRLINLFATLLTYVGMFFAAITGRGYVYKANKSMTSFADAAGGAADNVKELNKQLQGFDELNNLTTNENKDAGGAGAGPLANFEKVPVLDWIKDLADKIREIFERIMEPIKRAWAKVGDYVVAAWKRAFNSVKDLLLDIGRDFLKAWDKMGESIATNFLLIVGDVGNIIANIADSLREAWNYNENGYKIWMAILTIIDKVLAGIRRITKDMRDWSAQLNVTPAMTSFREWLESCEPVVESLMGVLFDFWNDALKPILTWAFDGENSGIARLFRIFRDFNKKVDWNKLRKNLDKIWKALGRFGQTIGEGLLLFLERLSDRLADWVNSGDFERTCDKIVEFFDSIEPEDIANDLDSILRDVKNIIEELKKPIKWVWEHKDQILSWLEKITSHIDTLAKVAVFGKLAIDLARFGANLYLMVSAIEKLAGAEGLGKIAGLVSSAFGEQGLSGVIALATEKLGGFMSTIGPVVTHIALIVLYIMWLKNEFKYLYENHETFRQSVDETISLIQDNIDSIIDNFKDIKENLDEISEKMGPIKDKLYEAFGSPATGILMTFGNLVLFITGLFSTLLGVLDALVQFINGDFQGAFQSISDTWNRMKENFTQLAENVKTHLSDIATALSLLNPTVAAFVQTLKGIIELIGYAIDGIKNLRDNMSGGSISSSIFGRAQSVSVPRLAQGAVIPPNNEFLAVLGDQKRGTNIESPLSTMVEAFNMANKGGSEQEIALLQEQNDLLRQLLQKEFGISNEAIFKSVRQSNSQYRKQTGTSAFA